MRLIFILTISLNALCLIGQNLNFEPSKVLFEYADSGTKVKFNSPFLPIDHDQDGDVDFIGGLLNKQYLMKNLGDETFEEIVLANGDQKSPFRVFDFDNDGDLDVILERSVLINNGNDEFSLEEINSRWVTYIAEFSDFNADDNLDFIFHHSGSGDEDLGIWYSNNDNESYTIDTLDTGYTEFGDMDLGDIDGDGDVDFALYIANSDEQVLIMYNEGDHFRQEVMPKIFNWASKSIKLTDLEEDGDLDFILSDDTYIYMIENDGTPTEYKNRVRVEDLFFFNTGDLDNDGDLDLVLVQKNSDWDITICVLEYLGNYEFADPVILVEFPGSSSFSLQQNDNYNEQNANIYDYDGDGKLDILYTAGFESPSTMNILINTTLIDSDNDGFELAEDCDDTNPAVNPNQPEVPYNGWDDDCDPMTLDDDLDMDGYINLEDCDDTNSNINPGVVEVPYNNLDDDCDPMTLDDDLDMDGYINEEDCDDTNADIYPGATEIANNGIDEDCDGEDLFSSVHELGSTSVSIYPNPVSTILNIDIEGNLTYDLKIYDLNGILIYSQRNQKIIATDRFKNGIYILTIQDLKSNKKIMERIVIAK